MLGDTAPDRCIKLGVTRQSIIKVWIAERLEKRASRGLAAGGAVHRRLQRVKCSLCLAAHRKHLGEMERDVIVGWGEAPMTPRP